MTSTFDVTTQLQDILLSSLPQTEPRRNNSQDSLQIAQNLRDPTLTDPQTLLTMNELPNQLLIRIRNTRTLEEDPLTLPEGNMGGVYFLHHTNKNISKTRLKDVAEDLGQNLPGPPPA